MWERDTRTARLGTDVDGGMLLWEELAVEGIVVGDTVVCSRIDVVFSVKVVLVELCTPDESGAEGLLF